MSQERISRSHETEATEQDYDAQKAILAREAIQHSDAAEDTDALLDMIEDVLEENAEEFVGAYKQKGGQ